MKAISIIKYVFTALGLALLAVAFFLYSSTNTFLNEAIKTEGTVIELLSARSEQSHVYKPVVQFVDQNGQRIEFTSSSGSNPPAYFEGESVEVLYPANEPQRAKISSFFSLWGTATILAVLGTVFFLIGASIVIAGRLSLGKKERLKTSGTPIQADFQGVELNTTLLVNGQHPFRIVSHWRNPVSAQLHIFKSDNIWFDPSAYIESDSIRVFIERSNPKKYYVDLSFLPQLA